MKTGRRITENAEVRYALLEDADGSQAEFWYSVTPVAHTRIADQLTALADAEAGILREFFIHSDSVMSKRFFCSDLQLHGELLQQYKQQKSEDWFFSVVEQPPAFGAKLALLGLCAGSITSKRRSGKCLVAEAASGVKHIFVEHLAVDDARADAETQAARLFLELEQILGAEGASIEDSVLRTWIYAPHLDADYPAIVKARNSVFSEVGFTPETHFIASTGIQGGGRCRFARVFMDVYALQGPGRGPVRYIQVPENMPPTHTYGVAFERATAVAIGSVDFLFISGTASIDKNGEIMHAGDVERQTGRTLENIEVVLAAGGFERNDLSSLIVYLRDAADYKFVQPLVEAYAGYVPAVYVKAAVCRPGWLVEIEATAARMRHKK